MRTLIATALVAHAISDETSLMQDRMKRSAGKLGTFSHATSNRKESTSKLLDTAVNMIKNGVTPDVIEFVDSTNSEINDEVLVAIQHEHDVDQTYINGLCAAFTAAIEALSRQATTIEAHDAQRMAASETHQTCRAEEALDCARHRRCQEQLRQKWRVVRREETLMREIHGHIEDEWCVHPPFFDAIPAWLSNPFNWAAMSPYPELDFPTDVVEFRHVSLTHFQEYIAQKIVVERAWLEYNEKLLECASFEEELELKSPVCDAAQVALREHACQHAVSNREAREEFGQEWDRIVRLFNEARIAKTASEEDRKNEWETLKIVQCLLDHVHSTVEVSIQTGGPCPNIESDPDGVTLAIDDCHIVPERTCSEGDMTAHLCLNWCEEPPVPNLPEVEEPACTPAYIAREQGSFMAQQQQMYVALLNAPDSVYPDDPLTDYDTQLSEARWAGCAAPLVCVDCAGLSTILPVAGFEANAQACHLHEEYLALGQSNSHTFRCHDGTCVSMAGRCNGVNNCADASDEIGCSADDHFVPAYVSRSFTCPANMNSDVHFQCANSECIEKVGLCNGIQNCADGSDEADCSGAIEVSLEATSGRTITVERAQSNIGVFHDREYFFVDLGHFAGKTFIKYSNDDKHTTHEHVMTKIRTVEPLTVYIVKLEDHVLEWLDLQGYQRSSYAGVRFSGIRETAHKEWDQTLLQYDDFSASAVWSKTFEAGTISIPGNDGGDGGFLIFLDRPGPGACDTMSHMMIQGCLNSPRDLEPACNLADVRCCSMDGTSCNSGNFPQAYAFSLGGTSEGTSCDAGQCNGVADTWCHSGVSFDQAQELCAANGERLCTRAEVEGGVCCGTGCSHNAHLIWFSDELPQ